MLTTTGHTTVCGCLQGKCDRLQLQNEGHKGGIVPLEAQISRLDSEIAGLEAASKQRQELIEQRTRDVSALNRKIEQTVAARGPDVHSGTLWLPSCSPTPASTYDSYPSVLF